MKLHHREMVSENGMLTRCVPLKSHDKMYKYSYVTLSLLFVNKLYKKQ